MSQPEMCPFTFRREGEWKCKVWRGEPCETTPDRYVKCEIYGEAYMIRSLPLPHCCPLIWKCHGDKPHHAIQHEKNCPCGDIDSDTLNSSPMYDYRGCEVFSKWFWEKAAKRIKK